MESYRRTYEMYCGKIPKGYEIHHIDFNHYNNDICNLVALPKELHQKYHKIAGDASLISFDATLKGRYSLGQGANYYAFEKAAEFMDVWKECQKYVYERDRQLYDHKSE